MRYVHVSIAPSANPAGWVSATRDFDTRLVSGLVASECERLASLSPREGVSIIIRVSR